MWRAVVVRTWGRRVTPFPAGPGSGPWERPCGGRGGSAFEALDARAGGAVLDDHAEGLQLIPDLV